MTEETAQLFDAPWKADKFVYYHPSGIGEINIRVQGSKNKLVAGYVTTIETANRIVRLPELYDACVEAVYYRCFDCLGGFRHDIGLTSEDLLNDGCPKKSNNCFFLKTIDLLRKVREGK